MGKTNKSKRWIVWVIVAAAVLSGLYFTILPGKKKETAMPPTQVRTISPADFRAATEKGEPHVLLDVRTPEEHAEKRIPGGMLIPLTPGDEFKKQVADRIPDRKASVFVYCRSGRRSGIAVGLMQEMGYLNAYNLGGIQDWPYETESD